jgi:endogenous inhibitor of DNA gyrase (YacG/DUF329 family)
VILEPVMAKKRIASLRCPICRKIVLRRDPEFPFCSERCRTIDLGKWASGGYAISSPIDRGDESGDADYTTGLARKVSGSPGGRPNGHTED